MDKNECNHDENCKKPFYKSRNFLIGIMLVVVAVTGGTVDYTGVLGDRIIFSSGEKVEKTDKIDQVKQSESTEQSAHD